MKLEVGKTYVFKSHKDKEDYIAGSPLNSQLYDNYYRGGFTILGISPRGAGRIVGFSVIFPDEVKYFKLKEEEQMKPDDIISVEMTALDGVKAAIMIGNTRGSYSLYTELKRKLNINDNRSLEVDREDCYDWRGGSRLTKLALDQFKDPKQDKINELEKVINDAAAELAKLKSE